MLNSMKIGDLLKSNNNTYKIVDIDRDWEGDKSNVFCYCLVNQKIIHKDAEDYIWLKEDEIKEFELI